MFEFLSALFDPTGFPPRWSCGTGWTPALGWTTVISDLLTWAAYTTIPLVLGYFVTRRRDVPFPRIFWLFGLFIFACGTVHLVEATIFWWPVYRLSALFKFLTAVASWGTVIALIPITPQALAFRSPLELEDEIERRTADLQRANDELRRAMAERESAESRFRQVIEAMPNGIVLVDEAGYIELVNSPLEELTGYHREELIGERIEVLVPESARGQHVGDRDAYLGEPVARPMGANRELTIRRKDGEAVPVEIGLNPIVGEEGTAVLSAIVDITERKQAEAALARHNQLLQRSNAELEQFAYVVSHDLRAPLRGIDRLSDWLEADLGPALNEDQRGQMQILRDRVRRMQGLIEGILQYSRVGRLDDRPQPVDLGPLIARLMEAMDLPDDVEVIIPTPLPTLPGYEIRLVQLFQNLIDNAVKYRLPAPLTITIDHRDAGRFWEFEFADNGPGIAPQHHERVFRMFQRLQGQEGEGVGIGLTLVQKIVETAGGTIRLESTGTPGEGTRYIFTWPKTR